MAARRAAVLEAARPVAQLLRLKPAAAQLL
jgi:hypothetical protein